MSNENPNKSPKPDTSKPSHLESIGGILLMLGLTIVAARVLFAVETPNPLFYGGIVLAFAGAFAWYYSGMPRAQVLEWIKSGLFAVLLALSIRWAVGEPYRIPSGSMEPTLHGDPDIGQGDRVFVNKWIYGLRFPFTKTRLWYGYAPERWDIVVFKSVEENAQHPTLVKRIVGMPGETVHIEGGNVYINGEILEIPDSMPADQYYTSAPGMRYGVIPEDQFAQVPEGHYLVLGDNSDNSRDGRYFGWLPNENIVGRVASIWWPPSRWRDFTGFSQTWWWRSFLALLAALVIGRLFVGRSWIVITRDGKGVEHLFVNFLKVGFRVPFTSIWAARWGAFERGDLVLYHCSDPKRTEGEPLLGRIAANPGEAIALIEGSIHVDGEPLNGAAWIEPGGYSMIHPEAEYGKPNKKAKSVVPEDHFFILAHHAGDEPVLDSRILGFVPKAAVIGKATRVWWPPRRMRTVN